MTVTDEAIAGIKRMILSGEAGPGEKLPREKELASRLGLSRSSLREAVRALTLMGVLNVRQGDGTYVTSLDPHLLLDSVGLVVELSQERTVLELLEVRRLIEPGATALGAARIDGAGIEKLRACLERMEAAPDAQALVEADDEFHETIVASAGNQTLSSLIRALSSRTMRARAWRALADEGVVEVTKLGHRNIYRAIEDRDPDLARAAATTHISEVEFWFRKALSVGDEEASERGREAWQR
ncbi:FCD domain-containing protein [Rubrobacter marinus]|uniref:FCD domain-containing protein n=1 Tax=Rubrobacter marinus TaxID=2653852 RepID=A0A6G8PZD9_9ACTN|nr:FadR/GntR family transcriptional regulator [Rubrobacter marinus]QIN79562.1 FCD domain-containing protein [Rubrobacter marinus]